MNKIKHNSTASLNNI